MTIQDLKDKGLIIFEGIVGSQSYGIATATSDTDIKGVYIMPLDGLLNFDYVEQISDDSNDTTYYELKRFLQLVQTNNPNILELLNLPQDCILYKDPIFDMILSQKDNLISKACKNSFGGYAVEQIKKARGLNKKIVKQFDEKRKGVLDFCYVTYNQGSMLVEDFIRLRYPNATQKDVGLVAIPHMRYTYGAYLKTPEEIAKDGYYKGIVQDPETANDISLSQIAKGIEPSFILQFNKDGYSTYCREYKEYWDWVEKRNPHRFADNMLHGGGYDGKNLAHCHRLLDMAIEIGEGKGINVRRENREQLLSIRRGEYDYDTLINEANEKIAKMDEVFLDANLPNDIPLSFINDLLLSMRKRRYFENLDMKEYGEYLIVKEAKMM
jgi:hypothetical protein